jgi:hypothetical protein
VTKPTILGSERWDPGNMMEWDTEEVILFIRRYVNRICSATELGKVVV